MGKCTSILVCLSLMGWACAPSKPVRVDPPTWASDVPTHCASTSVPHRGSTDLAEKSLESRAKRELLAFLRVKFDGEREASHHGSAYLTLLFELDAAFAKTLLDALAGTSALTEITAAGSRHYGLVCLERQPVVAALRAVQEAFAQIAEGQDATGRFFYAATQTKEDYDRALETVRGKYEEMLLGMMPQD